MPASPCPQGGEDGVTGHTWTQHTTVWTMHDRCHFTPVLVTASTWAVKKDMLGLILSIRAVRLALPNLVSALLPLPPSAVPQREWSPSFSEASCIWHIGAAHIAFCCSSPRFLCKPSTLLLREVAISDTKQCVHPPDLWPCCAHVHCPLYKAISPDHI